MGHARRGTRNSLAVVALGLGIAVSTGHGVAWADTGTSDTASAQAASKEPTTAPGKGTHRHGSSAVTRPPEKTTPADTDDTNGTPAATEPDPAAPQQDVTTQQKSTTDTDQVVTPKPAAHIRKGRPHLSVVTPQKTSARTVSTPETATTKNAITPQAATATKPDTGAKVVAVTTASSTTATTPSAPKPLSPIAKIAALPGKIINTVLQALGFTSAATGPQSPFNFRPIDEAIWGVFRRVEDFLGLTKTPAVQQYPPTEMYNGPTMTETPTVAQVLNAATAEYVLGGTPGGLQPFTVNGVQMSSTNILSGMRSQVWVTPDQQLIIAYQGTTGGTNLLTNPLMAVTQLFTDLQVIFTNTTPQAFWDALHFQKKVQTQAALQGYNSDDIFVTGHSLGGWEAEFVAQKTGLGGIGFESPGLNSKVDGNGRNSGFVNIETYGDPAAYMATDLPGLQPFMPTYVPGGGSKPHYGSIVMIGDPKADYPLINSSALFGKSLLGSIIFAGDFLVNFLGHHLPGQQAYNLDVDPDPGVVPWLGYRSGPVNEHYGTMTIPQLQIDASATGKLFAA